MMSSIIFGRGIRYEKKRRQMVDLIHLLMYILGTDTKVKIKYITDVESFRALHKIQKIGRRISNHYSVEGFFFKIHNTVEYSILC